MKHLNEKNLKQFKKMFISMNLNAKLKNFIICKFCVMRRMTESFHQNHIMSEFVSLNLIHINLCESFLIIKHNKEHYFLLIINDFI